MHQVDSIFKFCYSAFRFCIRSIWWWWWTGTSFTFIEMGTWKNSTGTWRDHGETPRRPSSWAMPQGLDQRSKMEVVQRWCTKEAQMWDNPEGFCTNVLLLHHGGAVLASLVSARSKWRGNFPEDPNPIQSLPIVWN